MNSLMLILPLMCGLFIALVVVSAVIYYYRFTAKLLLLGLLARIAKATSALPLRYFDKVALDDTVYMPRQGEVLLATRKPNVVSQSYPAMWHRLRIIPILSVIMGYSMLFILAGISLAFRNGWLLLLHPVLMALGYLLAGLPVIFEYWKSLWESLNSTYALFTHYLVILESKLPKGIFTSSGGLKRVSSFVSITSVRSIHDTKFGTQAEHVYGKATNEDEFEIFLREILAVQQSSFIKWWLDLPDAPIQLGLVPGFSAGASDQLPAIEDAEGFVALIPDAAYASAEYETFRQRKMGTQAEGALGKADIAGWTVSNALLKFGSMDDRFRQLLAAGILVVDPTPDMSRQGYTIARMEHATHFMPGELRQTSTAAAKIRSMINPVADLDDGNVGAL